MPGKVVVVHEDAPVTTALAKAIRAKGHTVQRFTDPMDAVELLEQTNQVELLITSVHFPSGKPNGCSLALMARMKHQGIQCIFLIRPIKDDYLHDLDNCMPLPVDLSRIACMAEALLKPTAIPGAAR